MDTLAEVNIGNEALPETGISAAEDIARFRQDFEHSVIDDNLPKTEWLNFSHQAFEKYPGIKEYERPISAAVLNAISSRDSLDHMWHKFGQPEEANEPTPEVGRKISIEVLKMDPSIQPKVTKGIFTMDILLKNEDYERYEQNLGLSKSGACSVSYDGVLVNIFNEDYWEKLIPVAVTHETEHSKNIVLTNTLREVSGKMYLEGEVGKGVRRLRQSSFPKAHNEVIAQFSPIKLIPKSVDPELLKQHILQQMIGDEGDVGYIDGQLKDESEKVGREKYAETLRSSVDSLFDLYSMYSDLGESEPDRMTLGVLSQFPFEKWPAVVRLFKQNHK